ncbi:MAG: AAA family ATPase, partial [Acidobacteria bacterium]|nr:AAA family ATPase [Acidobacteriota bacterium]
MFIDRIALKNVRGFEELEFSLDRGRQAYAGWTVFTGDNGSGKSALLKAVAVALTGRDDARALEPSFNGWIREGAHEADIEVEVVRVPADDSFVASGKTPAELRFPARIAFENGSRETAISVRTPPGKPKKGKYLTPQRSIWARDAHGWFSCGYGPFRRIFGASPEAMRQMVAPTTERFVTMFQEAASLAEVDQWLRDLKHKALEEKAEEKEQLQVLIDILRDDLMPNEITVDRVDSDGLWLKDRNGLKLAWGEMSDGYRAALALLADILRHLIKAYGIDGLWDRDSSGSILIKRSGVVLIDEIDAHLHPGWQREIGFWLKRH